METEFLTGEEDVLESTDFPNLHGLRERHAMVLRVLRHASSTAMTGQFSEARKVTELFRAWR